MAGEEYPLINGYVPSYSDIKTVIHITDGPTFRDIDYQELKLKSIISEDRQKGQSGGIDIARTSGDLANEGSGVFFRSGLRKFIKLLIPFAPMRGNQARVGLVQFSIDIFHEVPGDPELYHNIMRGCRLGSLEFSHTQGPDAEKVPIDFMPMQTIQVIDGVEVVLL